MESMIKDLCLEKGVAYFGFNNRGTGYVTSFNNYSGDAKDYATLGTGFETFEDCVKDIEGALKFLKSRGFKKLILCGHSTGSQKVAYYQSQKNNPDVKAVFLLAPVDDGQFQRKALGEKFGEALEMAAKAVSGGKGSDFVPREFQSPFFTYKRYYNMFKPGSAEGLLDPDKNFAALSKISCPVFAVLGEKDHGLTIDAKTVLDKIRKACKNKKSKTFLVEEADHGFEGKEDGLIEFMSSCLDAV